MDVTENPQKPQKTVTPLILGEFKALTSQFSSTQYIKLHNTEHATHNTIINLIGTIAIIFTMRRL